MDYTKAAKVRKKSLTEMIAKKKFEEGQGLGSSIREAFSEKLKAKSMGFKEKFHPMRLVGALTGKGVIGKSIRTIAGRAMGLSNDDVEHFGGYRKKFKRKHLSDLNITGIPDSLDMEGGGEESVGATAVILEKIFEFMRNNREEDKLKREVENSFREEQVDEDERRHQELVSAIKGFTKNNKSYIMEKGDDKQPTWWDSILNWVKDTFGNLLELAGLASLGKSLIGGLVNIIRALAGPGIGFAGLIALIYGGRKLLQWINGKTPDMKVVSPREAADALKGNDRTLIKNLGGKEKLIQIIKEGPKAAQEILDRGDEQEILKAGGEDKLKQIIKDGDIPVPTEEEMKSSEAPTTVPPRPDTTGGKNAGRAKTWDNKFSAEYNNDGTRKSKVEPVAKEEAKPEDKPTAVPAPSNAEVKKASTEATPKTEVKTKQASPSNVTPELNKSAPEPTSVPSPMINQSPGTTLPKQLSQEDVGNNGGSSAPMVAVNTTNTSIGGSQPTVVSLDSAKVRDSNIARHLRPAVV